jgi:hypothetical protein
MCAVVILAFLLFFIPVVGIPLGLALLVGVAVALIVSD